ncbi:hypothetical protein [Flavobacterium selenitireducens]|uniref:hypothetical protein n=1 Tax=Flavobacterium selenitireducens TaxID=2722704 RepID=UPI00168AF916|nr:hypothetical protein [Flavobacterium selenitireducens]MBD3581103.1 hypothetical protein [Flavobacterium selenitireducens]
MQPIRNDHDLQQAILELEKQKSDDGQALRDQWTLTKQNLNPMTLIKDGVKDLFAAPDVRTGVVKGLLGLASGFVTRKLVVGEKPSTVRKVVGTLAQTGVTSLAFKRSDAIQEKGASLLSGLLKKMKIGN